MHQHQLLTFAAKFNLFKSAAPSPEGPSFTDAHYGPLYTFFTPFKKGKRKLPPRLFRHLQEHYMTQHSLPTVRDPELMNISDEVEVWHRCRDDKTIYHCSEYRQSNFTRLNHLACVEQEIDQNARYRHGVRPERMASVEFYVYIQFFCVHTFRNASCMLMYSSYRKTDVHDALVEDMGAHHDGFQDVRILQHLCAKVKGHGGKVYFVDDQELMETRLRKDLNSKKRRR